MISFENYDIIRYQFNFEERKPIAFYASGDRRQQQQEKTNMKNDECDFMVQFDIIDKLAMFC